jgi:FdhE protein
MTPFQRRERRARFLAQSYPHSAEFLDFYAGIAMWQDSAAPHLKSLASMPDVIASLCHLVARTAPAALAQAVARVQPPMLVKFVRNYWSAGDDSPEVSADNFLARAILQAYAAGLPEGLDCPWCQKPPVAGCLTPQGDGQALHLICAICFRPKPCARGRCPACSGSSDSKIATFAAAEYPQLRVQVCETCRGYLIVADLSRDPAAIPEVDELAALPLDLWAIAQGYVKLQPNLAGV